MLQELGGICIFVVISHCIDEQKEAIGLKASVFVVMEGSRFEDFADHVVNHLNFRVINDDLVHEGDVLGGDVLFVGKKELHFKAAVFFAQDQFDHGQLISKVEFDVTVPS